GGLGAGTAVAVGAAYLLAGESAATVWLGVALVALLPATEVAVSTLNLLLTTILPPRTVPKLEMQGPRGIPEECRTSVVVPTLFDDVTAVEQALVDLEIQFLANRQKNLHFALLGDFTDAATEVREGDDEIVAAAVEGVRALNARYAPASRD